MNSIRKIIILCIIITVGSCDDIILNDISQEKVVLVSPKDNTSTYLSTQILWWEHVNDADYYQLQITTPDFIQPAILLVDTLTDENKYTINLLPGNYQWRVRAINSEYQTTYTTFSIKIDSSLNLENEKIILIKPIHFDTTNLLSISFKWEPLYKVDTFNFKLYHIGSLVFDTLVASNSIYKIIRHEGAYSWRVRGINSISATKYSERSFYIDTTPPQIRQLLLPENNSILYDTLVSCLWNSPLNEYSSEFDSIFFYSDPEHTNLIEHNKVFTHTIDIGLQPGKYYWRVKGFDKAGNSGIFSDTFTFEIYSK